VYNLDRARLEEFGSEQTPELSLGELARVAVAGPSAGEAVRVEGDLYVDGSVLDPFPAERFAADDGFDRVFALNASLPPGLDGAGERHRGADSERRLRLAQQLELARRTRERLGERLTLIEPLTDRPGTGSPFYDLFLDRRRWPDLMRAGYERTIEALRPLRRRRGGAR
jgi:predicted acylesterase/phospholipase RssA